MPSISDLLQSLGNPGAVANVRTVLVAAKREDWLVDGLVHRLAAQEDERSSTRRATAADAA